MLQVVKCGGTPNGLLPCPHCPTSIAKSASNAEEAPNVHDLCTVYRGTGTGIVPVQVVDIPPGTGVLN